MDAKKHWEDIYATKGDQQVSWFAPRLSTSLDLISRAGGTGSHVLDVGGGASRLADGLLERNYRRITVLDLSSSALEASKQRLGARAGEINWLTGSVLDLRLPESSIDVWHDRAVFHFFIDAGERKEYVRALLHSLAPGGTVVMGTFGPEGPERCSGLPVVRYSLESLLFELGNNFELVESREELHETPFGMTQQFNWSLFRVSGV